MHRHANGQQRLLDLRGGLRRGPGVDQRFERVFIGLALGQAGKARVVGQAWANYQFGQPLPFAVIAHRNRHPMGVVAGRRGAGKDTMRRHLRIAVSDGGRLDAVGRRLGDAGRQELDAGFGLRQIQPTALTGAAAVVERGQQTHQTKARRDEIGVRAEWADRQRVGPADDALVAGNRRAQVAKAGKGRPWARLAHQRSAEHHQAGLELAQGWVAQAPLGHLPGRERLDHHVGPVAHQVADHRTAAFAAQVQRQAELAGIAVLEQAGLLRVDRAAGERPHHPRRLDALAGFDPHHGGAKVGECAADQRAGDDPGQVQHLQACHRLDVFTHATTPCARNAAMSDVGIASQSASTSSVCWPSAGAGRGAA